MMKLRRRMREKVKCDEVTRCWIHGYHPWILIGESSRRDASKIANSVDYPSEEAAGHTETQYNSFHRSKYIFHFAGCSVCAFDDDEEGHTHTDTNGHCKGHHLQGKEKRVNWIIGRVTFMMLLHKTIKSFLPSERVTLPSPLSYSQLRLMTFWQRLTCTPCADVVRRGERNNFDKKGKILFAVVMARVVTTLSISSSIVPADLTLSETSKIEQVWSCGWSLHSDRERTDKVEGREKGETKEATYSCIHRRCECGKVSVKRERKRTPERWQ